MRPTGQSRGLSVGGKGSFMGESVRWPGKHSVCAVLGWFKGLANQFAFVCKADRLGERKQGAESWEGAVLSPHQTGS